MMRLKEQIANFFTLLNLVCGVGAILSISDLRTASLFVLAGAIFDLLDGLVARALRITSDIGKQLDSLCDMVTFGVVPGLIANQLIPGPGYGFIAILIPVFSAVRLAKFNIDTRQSKNFIGLPTPANALFWVSLALISVPKDGVFSFGLLSVIPINTFMQNLLNNNAFVLICIIGSSLLLVSPIRIFGFKFDKFSWEGNELRFILLIIAAPLLFLLGIAAIPIILLLFILFSIIHFYILKRDEIQS